MANTIGELNVEIGAKLDKLERGLNRMEKSIEKAGKQSEKTASKSFNKIGATIAAAFSVQAISGFVRKVIEVRSEFERYESVLANTLGSEAKAGLILSEIQDFAASTPFQLNELSGAFVKLTNYGLQPSMEAMRQYGDLASAVGKGFDQLAEAVADATTGEFERLKEFGIRASKEGDKVTFTFKEQATQVDFSAKAIQNYILSLGDLEGVSGSMEVQMDTLGGKVSNLEDNFNKLLTTVGNTDSWGNAVESISDATSLLDDFIKVSKKAEEQQTEEQKKREQYASGGAPGIGGLVELFNIGAERIRKAARKIDEEAKKTAEALVKQEDIVKANERAFWSLSYGMDAAGDKIEKVGEKTERTKESFARLGEIIRNRTSKETGKVGLKGEFDFRPATEFGDIIRIDPEIQKTLTENQEQLRQFEEQLAFTALTAETFGGVLQSSFEAALISGENFVEVFGDAIKNLILQLISAAATAAILAAVLAPISGVGFGATFRGLFLGTPGGGGGMGGNFGQFFVSGSNLVTSTNRARQQEGRSVR